MSSFWKYDASKITEFAKTRINYFVERAFSEKVDKQSLSSVQTDLLNDFKATAKDLRRIEKIPIGSKNRERSFRLYTKPSFQRTMLVLAMHNKPKRLEKLNLSLNDFEALPAKLCNVTKQAESFRIQLSLKSSGTGFRPICSFGTVRYVQQYGVKIILEAITPPPKYVSGPHESFLKIGDCLSSGKHFVVTTDVKNSFSSITKTHVRKLGLLDDRLIRYVLFPITKYSKTCFAQKETPQALLPQGGAASALIQSLVIDDVIGKPPKTNEVVIASADNIAICSETPTGAEEAFEALKWRMDNHSAGSLILHDTKKCDGRYFSKEYGQPYKYDHVWFMGRTISVFPPTNEINYRPNQKAFHRFWNRVQGIGYSGNMPTWKPDMPHELLEFIALDHLYEWSKSFPLWAINRELFFKFHLEDLNHITTADKDCPIYQRTQKAYTYFCLNYSERVDAFKSKELAKLAA